jgi:hypothetical protein
VLGTRSVLNGPGKPSVHVRRLLLRRLVLHLYATPFTLLSPHRSNQLLVTPLTLRRLPWIPGRVQEQRAGAVRERDVPVHGQVARQRLLGGALSRRRGELQWARPVSRPSVGATTAGLALIVPFVRDPCHAHAAALLDRRHGRWWCYPHDYIISDLPGRLLGQRAVQRSDESAGVRVSAFWGGSDCSVDQQRSSDDSSVTYRIVGGVLGGTSLSAPCPRFYLHVPLTTVALVITCGDDHNHVRTHEKEER